MSANISDRPANKALEKVIVDEGLGKKSSRYFISIVALDAPSSFVLFHELKVLE